MKQLLLSLVVTAAGVAAMSSAYAQQMPTDQPMDQTQAQAANASTDTGQGGVTWGSGAQGVRESRQDVRQQLLQSERDGQMKTLDDTVYKGN
ncbi:hypothetical protein [Paraburkholderia sp. C35]|uniref:hypothetical protein n=1 Tax=Paraburkholderia sp. C35 TaxID=2126993 RepID=UPI000D69D3A7|nr:hypothetical protein [Paraburkholderia sp. C35]